MRRVFVVPALCEFADGLVGRVALATSGFGQEVSGTVIGTVVDSTGAAVVNVEIRASNVATGIAVTTKANATGEDRFNNLPVGTFNLSVSAHCLQTSADRRQWA